MNHASILKAISLHLFLYLLNWYIEAALFFVTVSVAALIFPYFQFSPQPLSEVTKPTNTMHLWHILWESDMALVIAHFWIHPFCLTPGIETTPTYRNGSWYEIKCSVKDMSLCTCAFVYVQVWMMKMSALNS